MQNIQKRILFTLLACSLFGAGNKINTGNRLQFALAIESDRYKLIKLIKSLLDISAVILIEKQEAAVDNESTERDKNFAQSPDYIIKNKTNKEADASAEAVLADENKEADASAEAVLADENKEADASEQAAVSNDSKESQEDNEIIQMINKISRKIDQKGLYYDQIANSDSIDSINSLNEKLDKIYKYRLRKNNLTKENKEILEIILKIKEFIGVFIGVFDKTKLKQDLTINLIELLNSLTRYVDSLSDEKSDKKFNAAKQALRRTHKTIGILIHGFTRKSLEIT